MREDDLFAEAVEPHVRPASPSFFEQFWREAEQRQRRAARRWRVIALALAAVAAAATSAAGVMASARTGTAAVVDQTWQCGPGRLAQGPTLGVHASPKTPRTDAFFQLSSQQTSPEFGALGLAAVHFDAMSPSVTWDTHACKRVGARPGFTSRGLAADNVYTSTFIGGFTGTCVTPPSVLIRAHVAFSRGHAADARVIVLAASTRRPVAYFTWTPHRIAVWLARSCHLDDYPY